MLYNRVTDSYVTVFFFGCRFQKYVQMCIYVFFFNAGIEPAEWNIQQRK